jgi:hypothetical protein
VRQLNLFDGPRYPPAPEPVPAEPAEPEAPEWPEVSDVLPGQLHLFSDRAVRLGHARAAIAEARLDDARRELAELKERFPDDPFMAREAARVAKLSRKLAAALAAPPEERAAALLAFARSSPGAPSRSARSAGDAGEPWSSLHRALLRHVAHALAARGDDALLEGEPPGFYLIAAGDVQGAREQLARAVLRAPGAHALFLLGDASFLAGAVPDARRAYLGALLADPFDRGIESARDDDVRALPDVARDEVGIEEAPAAWSAPVGVVYGVLPWPSGLPRELIEAVGVGGRTGTEQRALGDARAFVEALAESTSPAGRGAAAIEVRRRMKRLSPALFAAYMDRVVRGVRELRPR